MSATYTVSGRKFADLNGSHGTHHGHQALMNAWQQLAIFGIRQAKCRPVPTPVVITAVVRRVRAGRADAHNVTPTIKACIDAAVAEGLIPDDSDAEVVELRIRGGAKADRPTVEITIEEAL